MSKRISESEALALMRKNGLEPQEPYPGLHKPWKSKCLKCKRNVSPHFTSVRHRGSGCAYCAGKKVDPEFACKVMTDAGYKPLKPFPGSSKKWESECVRCGSIVYPRYDNIKQGWGGCKLCANLLVNPKDAEHLLKSNGLTPLTAYPGSKRPWPSICTQCNNIVNPRYSDIRLKKSSGCKFCAGSVVLEKDAQEFMRSQGFTPIVPYPGASKRWLGRCKKCKNEITPIYSTVKNGQGICKYCARKALSEKDAMALLKKSGFRPVEKYTKAGNKLLCVCLKCKKQIRVRLYGLLQGESGCAFCAGVKVDPGDAIRFMKKNGFIPQEDFPGAKARWLCKCQKCKKLSKPAYSNVLQGSRCIFCNRDGGTWDDSAPGSLYLIFHKEMNAYKIGITHNLISRKGRLKEHSRNGWELLNSFSYSKAIDAFEVEQRILDFFQTEGLLPFLKPIDLPQGGWTETVDASEIESVTIWNKVLEFSKVRK